MKTVLIFLAFIGAAVAGTNWAVLIAGSNTYGNYRHQADIYHAYQILHQNGFPDDNIVVMHYDDLAKNPQNPFQGNVINKPNGPNVYPGVPKDYIGRDVNKKNFLAVISGDKSSATGKVIESSSDDNIFIYYADHGAAGLVGMPDANYLYATELLPVLKKMSTDGKFKNLVFYMEACESGSMFEDLPDNIQIYATTAANDHESSYACYFDSKRSTYLGDVYSVNWLENSDLGKMTSESLDDQYDVVKQETNTSHVMKFGQTDMGSDMIGLFQAFKQEGKTFHRVRASNIAPMTDAVDSRDVALETLIRRYAAATGPQKTHIEAELRLELAHREEVESLMTDLATEVAGNANAMTAQYKRLHGQCLKDMVETVEEHCGKFSDYGFKYIRVLANLCDSGFDHEHMEAAVKKHC